MLAIYRLARKDTVQHSVSGAIGVLICAYFANRSGNAIDFYSNKKQLKWLLIPLAIFILFFISGKDYILTESSARIVKHNTFFEPKAPFNYQILNDNLN